MAARQEVRRSGGILTTVLRSLVLWAILCSSAWCYDFPVEDSYAATIAGTPNEYKAKLPEKVPVDELRLQVSRRALPPVFWYHKGLSYSLSRQKQPAPLIFLIAAAGAGHNAPIMQTLTRAFYQAGFHVLCLPSPTHANFMATASTTGIPGHLPDDARDLYRVMMLIRDRHREDISVTGYYLAGYSLGGADAAFVARLDDEEREFAFKKVMMINPPVNLYSSMQIIDRLLMKNLPLDRLNPFLDRVMDSLSGYYQRIPALDFNNLVLYRVFEENGVTEKELAALIGLSFRLVSSNMMFTADVLNNHGYLVPKNRVLSSTDSTTNYLKVAFRIGFQQYFDEFFYPAFKERFPEIDRQRLIEHNTLNSIDGYLRGNRKIGVMCNADDFILTPGELDYLRELFGERARIYPRGGHLGNVDHRENVADMLRFFRD